MGTAGQPFISFAGITRFAEPRPPLDGTNPCGRVIGTSPPNGSSDVAGDVVCLNRANVEGAPALSPLFHKRVERFLASHLQGVRRCVAHFSVCMYTLTPDEHFIVDRHPSDPRIVLATGLSGDGFKFTCVLGEALADMAMNGCTDLPIGFLSVDRTSLR
jgi:glycine/D-amino acid oxidase-like deaminating enzyme